MAMPPTMALPMISLDTFTGAAFVGFVVSVVIYGITCLQAYMYYVDYSSEDRKSLKFFVALLVALDTVHIALVAHALYWYMVTNFDHPLELFHIIWSLSAQVGIAELLAVCVQNFFAWRVYLLSGRTNVWAPAFISLCSVGLLVAATGFMYNALHSPSFLLLGDQIAWFSAYTVFGVLTDGIIMIGLICYLVRARTGFDRTHKILSTLMYYALNTGLLTTVFAILTLVFFIRDRHTLLYAPFYFVLCRIHACSFLSTLNTRQTLRNTSGSTPSQDRAVVLSDFSDAHRAHNSGRVNIKVISTVESQV